MAVAVGSAAAGGRTDAIVRARQVSTEQRQVLAELAHRISNKLEAHFTDAADADGPHVGVVLSERGDSVTIEVPVTELTNAVESVTGREALRVRLKGRRDRMMFRAPPSPLPKRIVAASAFSNGGGYGRPFGGGGRGRR